MNSTYRKNLKSIATACKNYTDTEITEAKTYTDEKVSDLAWRLGANNLSVETDTSTGYTSSVPSGTIAAKFTKVGGMSYPYNQLVQNGNFSDSGTGWSANNATFSVSNNVANFIATAQNGNINYYVQNYIDDHKYLAMVQIKLTTATTDVQLYCNGGYGSAYTTATTEWQTLSKIFTGVSTDTRNVQVRDKRSSDWDAIQVKQFMLFDLTDLFGSGNEPADVATATTQLASIGIDINTYNEYSTGKLRHAKVSSVDIEGINVFGSNDVATGTYVSVTSKVENNTFYLDGTTDAYGIFLPKTNLLTPIKAGTYSARYFIKSGTGANVWIALYDADGNIVDQQSMTTTAKTLTFSKDIVAYRLFNWSGSTYTNFYFYFSFSRSAVDTYTSYVAPINKAIPASVQALDGYGMGRSGAYNYIDFNAKKFNASTYTQVFTGLENGWALRSGNSHTFEIACNRFPNKTPMNNILLRATTETFGWKDLLSSEIDTIDGVYTNATSTFIVTVMSCSTLAEFQTYLQTHLLALNYDITPVETDITTDMANWDNPIEFTDDYGTVQYTNEDELDLPYSITYLKEVAK